MDIKRKHPKHYLLFPETRAFIPDVVHTVRKTGNANSVTIPESSGLKAGDKVILIQDPDGKIIIRKQQENIDRDKRYREGLESGATESLIKQFDWLLRHNFSAKTLNMKKMMDYVFDRLMPKDDQAEALFDLPIEICFQEGKSKGQEIAILEGLKYLASKDLLEKMEKEDQLDLVLFANPSMDQDSARSLIFGKA